MTAQILDILVRQPEPGSLSLSAKDSDLLASLPHEVVHALARTLSPIGCSDPSLSLS